MKHVIVVCVYGGYLKLCCLDCWCYHSALREAVTGEEWVGVH